MDHGPSTHNHKHLPEIVPLALNYPETANEEPGQFPRPRPFGSSRPKQKRGRRVSGRVPSRSGADPISGATTQVLVSPSSRDVHVQEGSEAMRQGVDAVGSDAIR